MHWLPYVRLYQRMERLISILDLVCLIVKTSTNGVDGLISIYVVGVVDIANTIFYRSKEVYITR